MSSNGSPGRSFEVLGISEAEEKVYRWLLAHPGATVQEVSRAVEVAPNKAQRLLGSIEDKGLTTHSPEKPRRYIPIAADIALKALIHRHQESLQQAEAAVETLQEQTAAQRCDEGEQIDELVTSLEASRRTLDQVQLSAQHEIIALVRPPILLTKMNDKKELKEDKLVQRGIQAKGMRYRSIADTAFFTLPGAVQGILEDMKAGEEVRVAPHLPLKMLLADRRVAFIPLLDRPDSVVLLVRSSVLVDALYALFEVLWDRASPLSFTPPGEPEIVVSDSRSPEDAKTLFSLMAAGLNDKKIAHELGLSLRTHYRRVNEQMENIGAQTRFQLGWLAALREFGFSDKEGEPR